MTTEYRQTIEAMSLRDLRTYCALFTRDPAMKLWTRAQCVAYVAAWSAV